jgi:hypothetical protein
MLDTWHDARRETPPLGKPVVVLLANALVPLVGWYSGLAQGPPGAKGQFYAWRVPGMGGTPTHWSDCIPPATEPPPPEKVAGAVVRPGP